MSVLLILLEGCDETGDGEGVGDWMCGVSVWMRWHTKVNYC